MLIQATIHSDPASDYGFDFILSNFLLSVILEIYFLLQNRILEIVNSIASLNHQTYSLVLPPRA